MLGGNERRQKDDAFGERSFPSEARRRRREYWRIVTETTDYEQSLFFLGPSSKTPETRK